MEQNIQVFVRCRPLNPHERRSEVEVTTDKNEVIIKDRTSKSQDTKSFYYDKVFDVNSDQKAVYSSVVKPLVDQVLLGFNCTVFAYGQTGTGKTYTMEGGRSTEDLSWEDDPHSGIIPRAVSQLFDTLKDRDSKFSVCVSFLELYNEDTYDLLSSIDDTTKLKIFDTTQKKGSVIVDGLQEIFVESKAEIYNILKRGSAKRQTAATLLNACSSRSHTIFTITVQVQDDEITRTGKLNLVDLAGSENIARSGLQNKHAREAGNINQSLLTLTRVITALVEKRPHIPYRESKLTRILQDSIGGNAKTSMIATISMAQDDLGNTLGTLDYASRARRITNKIDSQLQRKPSDLDLEAFKSELEFNIRNEVALEFQRETDKIREVYKKENADLRQAIRDISGAKDSEIAALRETIKSRVQENDSEMAALQETINNVTRAKDHEIVELRETIQCITCEKDREIAELQETIKKITGEVEQLRSAKEKDAEVDNVDVVQRMLYERIDECENFKAENKELKRNLDECTCKRPKKVQKIRKEAPIDEEDEVHEYANMTFDNDDEIIQVSARKPKSQLAGKRGVRKELTMSGKKKRLRCIEDDETRYIGNVRGITRARPNLATGIPAQVYISNIGDKNNKDGSQPKRSKRRAAKHGKDNAAKEAAAAAAATAAAAARDNKEDSATSDNRGTGYQDIIGSLVAREFKLIKLLGSGSYGAVYLGKNIVTQEQVAVKLEHKATKAPQLPLEYRFIKMIGPVEGFPRIIRIDECAGTYHAMVMELLGPSLEEVFNVCERRLSLKSVLYLSLQLLTRFQTLHSKNIIYRDVKPENFLLGRPGMDKEHIVHIIDYGLAKEYINPESGTHIAFRGQRGAIGTARYMSVNTHMGKEQSRRDDLEALGYVLIYLTRGSLPWQGLPATDHRERMRKIGEMKRRLPVEEICERCPDEFARYLSYVKHLDFYDAPDYDYLKKLFYDLFVANRFVDDGVYDWSGKFESRTT